MRLTGLLLFIGISCNSVAQQYGWLQTIRPGGDEYCWDVATDALGYVYATGRVKAFSDFGTPGNMQSPPPIGVAESDVFLVKYSPTGSLVWARRHGGYQPDWGRQVTVDKDYNPIIVGDYCDTAHFGSIFLDAAGAAQNRNIFVAKYDSAGTCLWAKTAGNAANYSRAYGVITDEVGNVYVTGHVSGPTNFDGINFGITGLNVPFIAKFRANGNCVWVRHISCQFGGEGYDIGYHNGKLLITGAYRGTMTIGGNPYAGNSSSWSDVFTMRLDTSNVVDWVRTATGAYQDNPLGMDVDDNGNIYIGGIFANDLIFPGQTIYSMTMGTTATQANNGHGSFLAKYDFNGNFQWVRSITSSNIVDVNDVEVTHSGKVLVAAFVVDTFYTDGQQFNFNEANVNALVICYDDDGNWKWNKLTGAGAQNGASAYGICNDAHDNIFVGGKYLGPTCDFDGFTVPGGALWDAYIAKLYPPLDPVITVSDTGLCEGEQTAFTVQQDGWPLNINWNFTGGNPGAGANDTMQVAYLSSGTYTTGVTLSFPVTAPPLTFTAPVINVSSQPVINLGNDAVLCPGDTMLLDAGPGFAQYTWGGGQSTQTITAANGNYSVSVSNALGCQASDSIQITYQIVQPPQLGNDTTLCDGLSWQLNAGSYASYQWSTGDSVASITVTGNGIYSVEVTDTVGCISSDTMVLQYFPPVTFSLGNDTTVCQQQPVTITAPSGFSAYNWSVPGSTNQVTVNNPGVYFLTVTDNSNCQGNDTIAIINFTQNYPDLGPDSVICDDDNILLDAGSYASYVWQDNSVMQTLMVSDSGYYAVQVTDANGCVMSDTVKISEEDCSGINEYENSGWSVYPNPAHNLIFIRHVQNLPVQQVTLYNAIGESIPITYSPAQITFSAPPGMYILVLRSAGSSWSTRMVIE